MAPQSPLLSVCIPTYNRKAYLSQALDALSSHLPATMRELVEIVISDNASSDGTEDLIDEFQSQHIDIQLRCLRQPENIGATRNCWFVTQAACGDYVYLLSDDDILLPGALERIVSVIQTHPDLDAVCPKVSGFFVSPEEVRPLKPPSDDDLIIDRNQSLIRLGTMLTFMSSVVFRRETGCAGLANHETLFPHSLMFLTAIAREDGCYFLSQECLAVRGTNRSAMI